MNSKCFGKKRFADGWEAQDQLNRFAVRTGDHTMVTYSCEHCGCWHIGHPSGTSLLGRIKAFRETHWRAAGCKSNRKLLRQAPRFGNTKSKLAHLDGPSYIVDTLLAHQHPDSWIELQRSSNWEWVLTIGIQKQVIGWAYRFGEKEGMLLLTSDGRSELLSWHDSLYVAFRLRESIGA